MTDSNLIREIINYIQLSTMEPREKAMWMLLLPQMEEAKLLKLKTSLEKEVNAITDLYLNSVSAK
jgi:hypothetical protein